MNRRTFLKLAGMGSVSLAASCTSDSEQYLYSLVQAPANMVTGRATWYASTCRECPAGCGILANNREGRVIKVEGNPRHPINRGKLCVRGQAALQGVYNPDRLKTPRLKAKDGWQPISFPKAQAILKNKAKEAAQKGPDRVRMLTEVVGDSLLTLLTQSLQNWNSQGPLVFELYAYESLKTANEKIFGVNALPSYRLDQADVLVSFGADFLETWLSPVEYARRFKAMHAIRNAAKGLFFQISPYQSLTGANADHWLGCKPGREAAVALGLIKQALDIGKGKQLPASLRTALAGATAPYIQALVLEQSGIELELYEKLILQLMEAQKPLVLGTSSSASDLNALQTNLAANLLNLILDPELSLLDFADRHRVELAARRSEVLDFFKALGSDAVDLLLLNNVNPVYGISPSNGIKEALQNKALFVVSFSNFMEETSQLADLILPVSLPLETWDEYAGKSSVVATLQPAMGKLTPAPHLGDVFLTAAFTPPRPAADFKTYLLDRLVAENKITDALSWVQTLQHGGIFEASGEPDAKPEKLEPDKDKFIEILKATSQRPPADLFFVAAPSIRFFDGRGANKPWLNEIPDPLTRVAWQSPVLMHPQTARQKGIHEGDIIQIQSQWGNLEAPVYETEVVRPATLVMSIGQGHESYGRYAQGQGRNPLALLSPEVAADTGGAQLTAEGVTFRPTGRTMTLALMSGSRTQHGRKYALAIDLKALQAGGVPPKHGLAMDDFPFTLPLPEGYRPERDFYPPHQHDQYRWGMVVDLDRCIGCGACAAACYAENNLGIVGEDRVIQGREMAWLSIERFEDPRRREKIIFLPMLCQHCDNAPCESVCPVYAPHHSKEGINNQIYNRCIGTRFCSQNCPYKVRRFNWFTWQWPKPLNLQLNPDVTARSKGVMEKCSFCIQRIKAAHTTATLAKRMIRD
ncbi:MAG: 4Fe-4S dicluster domain-containing protein, partial [Desulfobacterales bacterium]